MMKRALMAGMLLMLAAAVGLAADLNGRWQGSLDGPNGEVQLVFNFKVDGNSLSGSVETPDGNADITEGKVDGHKFSFKTHIGDNTEINHTGTISGDAIQLKIEGPWGESEMKLTRAPSPPAKPNP